jgi:hypothetical protein
MLGHYLSSPQHDWSDNLSSLEFANNNSLQASTGYIPFELDLGYKPLPPHTIEDQSGLQDIQAVNKFRDRLDKMTTLAQDSIRKAQEQQSKYYNLKKKEATFKEGDYVMLSTKYIRPPGHKAKGSVKLRAKYIGHFCILKLVGQNAYELDLPDTLQVHSVINVEYLKPYISNPLEYKNREEPPPPPVIDPESKELEYVVDKIVNHRFSKARRNATRKISYLTHWKGYPDYEDTWQSPESLKGLEKKIKEYWRTQGRTGPPSPNEQASRKRTTRSNYVTFTH